MLGNGIKIKFNYMKIGIIGQGFVGGAVYLKNGIIIKRWVKNSGQ